MTEKLYISSGIDSELLKQNASTVEKQERNKMSNEKKCEDCYHYSFNYTTEKFECFNLVVCEGNNRWSPSIATLELENRSLKQEFETERAKVEELEQRDINRLFHKAVVQITELEKKLGEAVEVIEFYGNPENYHQRKEDVFDYIQSDVSFENYLYYGGKRARDFLEENKYE